MTLTKDQLNALLLGLFAAGGPIAKILIDLLHLDSQTATTILDIATVLTPTIAGIMFAYLQRPSAAVTSVASLSAGEQRAALNQVSDAAKVSIAEGVADVATVVVKDKANGGLALLAASDAHPGVITEAQNVIDTRKANP